jgi:hypothetical protein
MISNMGKARNLGQMELSMKGSTVKGKSMVKVS